MDLCMDPSYYQSILHYWTSIPPRYLWIVRIVARDENSSVLFLGVLRHFLGTIGDAQMRDHFVLLL